jgi:hypothetical protein
VERPQDLPLGVLTDLRTSVARLETTVAHLASDTAEMRQEFRTDIRRLDERVFRVLLLQFATLAAALGALVTALVS